MGQGSNICYIITLVLLFLIIGSSTTVWTKLQDTVKVDGKKFKHPVMQTSWYFWGQMLMHIVRWIKPYFQKDYKENLRQEQEEALKKGLKIDPSPFLMLITAFTEWSAMVLYYVVFLCIPASIIEMIRGAILIYVAVFSCIFLKKKLNKSEILGVFLVFIGVVIVGYALITHDRYNGNQQQINNLWIGMTCLMFSCALDATFFVIVELCFKTYHIQPLYMISWQGTWGFIINLIPIIILNSLPCNPSIKVLCAGDYFESTSQWWYQIKQSGLLKLALLGYTVSSSSYQTTSYEIIKQTSALTRTLLKQIQPILIWLVCFLLGWEDYIFLQFVGFFLILIGNMIYQQVFGKICAAIFAQKDKKINIDEEKINSELDKKLLKNVELVVPQKE